MIDKQRTNLADVKYLDLDSITKLVENFDNPQIEEDFSNKNHHSLNRAVLNELVSHYNKAGVPVDILKMWDNL